MVSIGTGEAGMMRRIDGKSKHLGNFGLLWNALIRANYHIDHHLGLNMPLNDIAELSKTHPVLIA